MVLGSGIRDPGSGIWKKPIPDPGSRGQKGTGSRIRIRNTAYTAFTCTLKAFLKHFSRPLHKEKRFCFSEKNFKTPKATEI